ncbi:hypothetical protein DSO57_1033964 [Entomophthora muscae]|uniref:Uncharacterized protein n=1 Tax=Entomophthora muscae TaxID=34485 RepID=A0ACC2UAS0_9FUNG|nr:hypothetical protein DSO57_1033964 [Entomophthora muscae]
MIKRGMFIGEFLAVLAKGFAYYWTKPDFTNGHKYNQILSEFLNSWDSSNPTYQLFLSKKIKGSSTVLKAIQGHMHQAPVYPTGHADIHLADVVFFNIVDTVQQRLPQAFKDLYIGILNHDSLFGQKMMADLFAQIVFHVIMDNQLQKDKRLPPCVKAFYQPIQSMTDNFMAWVTPRGTFGQGEGSIL